MDEANKIEELRITTSITKNESTESQCIIVVFVNSKSGGRLGKLLIPPLVKIFGEAYVIDLILSNGAKTTLKTLSTAQNLRIIVCGGDGTVQWVFSDIDTLIDEGIFTIRPAVAILPLGTGNDLSRQFGWGHGFNRGLVSLLKKDVSSAPVAHLDRWNINIVNDIDSVNQPTAEYKLKMSNYFGIGLDAKVVNNFEGCRKLYPSLFCCRLSNNMIYGWYGITNCLRRPIILSSVLKITVDGEDVQLPKNIQGFSVLNLQYFCSGINMWKKDSGGLDDGLLETFVFPGAFYLGAVKFGVITPKRLNQCKEIVIESTSLFPQKSSINIQIDGETKTLTAPFKIAISKSNHSAIVLRGIHKPSGMCDICC